MSHRGFTLIELMVSIALLALLTTTAITVTMQAVTVTRRMQARQFMDGSARTACNRLRAEVATMHPCAAVWLNAKKDASVELIFLCAAPTPFDGMESRLASGQMRRVYLTDQVWTRWYWDASALTLTASSSRRARWTRAYADPAMHEGKDYWQILSGTKMAGLKHSATEFDEPYFSTLLCLPQPQRDTGLPVDDATTPVDERNSPVALLDANNWNTQAHPEMTIGDYTDLVREAAARPQLVACTDFSIGIRSVDGSTVLADAQNNLAWSVAGSFVDGGYIGSATDKRCGAKGNLAAGPWNQSDLGKRPGVVQIRFTLRDEKTGSSSTYSFSCAPPGSVHN